MAPSCEDTPRLYTPPLNRALRDAVDLNRRGDWEAARTSLRAVARRVRSYAGSDEVLRGIVAELEREAEAWSVARMESDRKVTIYDKGAVVPQYESYGEYVSLRFGDIHIPRIGNDEPLRLECQHFIDCIVNDTSPRSDGMDGLRVVMVLEAGSRSLQRGGAPISLQQHPLFEPMEAA